MQVKVFRKCASCVNMQLRKLSGVSCQHCHPVINLVLPLHLITVGDSPVNAEIEHFLDFDIEP